MRGECTGSRISRSLKENSDQRGRERREKMKMSDLR